MKYTLRPGAEEEILSKIADMHAGDEEARTTFQRPSRRVIQHKVRPVAPAQHRPAEESWNATSSSRCLTALNSKPALRPSCHPCCCRWPAAVFTRRLLIEDWETDDLKKVKKVHQLHDHKIEALKETRGGSRERGQAATRGLPLPIQPREAHQGIPEGRGHGQGRQVHQGMERRQDPDAA
jgi:hypothetical protein